MTLFRRYLPLALAALFLVMAKASFSQHLPPVLAQTPPMGWNSWDAYGLTITEMQFRDNVAVLADKLKPFGWNYAVIDEGWFLKNPLDRPRPEKLQFQIDDYGRYIPVPARFPSTQGNGSFQALGEYVHQQGLKFGIHIVRGIPRESVARNLPVENSAFKASDVADTTDACPWDPTNWGVKDNAAGQAWYDSLLKQYASWGIDYLKVDCIADNPYKVTEIRMIHRAIEKTGRPIMLSLSPGPTALDHAREVGELAQLWRISNDIWDFWTNPRKFPRSVHDQFALLDAWQPYVKPGNWPDADMLPLGYLGPFPGDGNARDSRLTQNEQRTMITLWSIARSPLILGANLTKLDPWTLSLLTNPGVIAMDQQGHNQKQAKHEDDLIAWTSEGAPGQHYLALFNLGDKELVVDRPYDEFGLPKRQFKVRDLWTGAPVEIGIGPIARGLRETLPPHSCVLLELKER
jgi:alpha-galactosidase